PVEKITIADRNPDLARAAAEKIGTPAVAAQIDTADHEAVVNLMRGHDAAISCVNYWFNESLTKAAIETKVHFCDLGGNNYVVDAQLRLDADA
ncbi:saccharopine dehydrogenase NADP-binding domain-containing protein, partial [Escherichia coli]|nr:saccharopine dehydrogenase NADP-binding domain-containing protein [Escherichia coli]